MGKYFMSDIDLSSLVIRAQTGDRVAYDGIVRRFQDMAVGYASALLGDFHLAEDAAQEAFVGAWTELPRLREPAAFPGWFKRIVFMRCSRFLRRRHSVVGHEIEEVWPMATSDPGEELESRDEKAKVLGAIGRLPDQEQMATMLFYISDYSHQEIASFLGLSAATVNNRLRSARKHLRKEMLKMARRELQGQAPSRDERFAQRVAHLLQPEENASRGRALFEACAGNHLETAKLLLERGADPNAGVDSSGSCLTIVEFNHGKKGRQMQTLLREHGAVTPPYAMDDAALERAMREGDAVVAHSQFLHELMGRDNPALIGVFLEITPDVGDLFQLTDIWGGNYPSDPDTIRTLADHGLSLHRANWIGRTFLHGCAEKGDVAAARVFLELGADIEAVELEYGGTPLAAAARKGQAEMVRFLLEQGADPAAPAESRWAQPLYWAEKKGHGEVAALLKGGKGASGG